jgi:hypothetical protein
MEKLILMLSEALEKPLDRVELVKEFQKKVLEIDMEDEPDSLLEVLRDLALDLEYYEPNPEYRKEDSSFYGNERLEQEIKKALQKIEKIKAQK